MSQRVKKKASPMARQEAVAGYVFILPTILLYLCLTIIPIIVTFSLSFMDYDLVKPSTFIGFDNYIKLFQDSRLGQVALNTVLFALMSVVGNVGIGLLLAVILNRKMPKFFVNFFRFSFFLPVVIGYVYVSIVWSNLYSTDTGVFNYFLSLLGLEKVGWLTNKSIVLFSIILMDIWKNAGFFMVIFLAGLQNIPAQYYEAAQIDGANRFPLFLNSCWKNLISCWSVIWSNNFSTASTRILKKRVILESFASSEILSGFPVSQRHASRGFSIICSGASRAILIQRSKSSPCIIAIS